MDQPKFTVGQTVKIIGDKMAGKVASFTYDSSDGYTYRITSKFYNPEKQDMVEGIATVKEAELEAFEGDTDPEKVDPTHVVKLDDAAAEKVTEEPAADTPAEEEKSE